jgi:diaminopimelate epimerase
MDFFNNDGRPAEMCGNGLRCAALFASTHMNRSSDLLFETDAGKLRAQVRSNLQVRIELPLRKMPEKIFIDDKICFITDTGVPHLVVEVDNIEEFDVHTNGKRLRNHVDLAPNGANVDFVEFSRETSKACIRTYERGVEEETQACGTGVAAVAVCAACFLDVIPPIDFKTAGGDILTVDFSSKGGIVNCDMNLFLTGPAKEVYTGELSLSHFEN